jgi:hypothetical protein
MLEDREKEWGSYKMEVVIRECRNLILKECEDDTHIPEMGTWESFGTSKNLKFDCKGQNPLLWGVLYTVGNVLKCRCRKWPCMSHSEICSTSYGRKKGRESNWQFDFRPLKVGNRPDPSVFKWSATHCWKALEESYKFASNLISIGGLSKELWTPKVLGVETKTVLGLILGSPGTKKPFGCGCHREAQRIIYGRRLWFPPSPGCGESCESRVARDLS